MEAERELPVVQIYEPGLEWQMDPEDNKRIRNLVKNLTKKTPGGETQQRIKIPMPLEGWQVELLIGIITAYEMNWSEIDVNNNNTAIYAALSGKTEPLEFIFNNHPYLCLDKTGLVNHFFLEALFFSQSIESLDYVWNRYQNSLPVDFDELAMASVILIDWLEGCKWLENKFSNIWETHIRCDVGYLNPIQFAAEFNRMCFVEYLNNSPEKQHFLHQRTSNGFTIAHLFAKTGYIEGLYFIKHNNNLSYMLNMFDNENNINCAHLATASGNPKVLDFFYKHYKPLLSKKGEGQKDFESGIEFLDCINMAIISKNPQQLNLILSLSENPSFLDVNLNYLVMGHLDEYRPAVEGVIHNQEQILLNIALDENLSLSKIKISKHPYIWKEDVYQEIYQKLVRNNLLKCFNNLTILYCSMSQGGYSSALPLDIFNFFIQQLQDWLQPEKLIENIEYVIEKKPYVCDQTFFAQARLMAKNSDANCVFNSELDLKSLDL